MMILMNMVILIWFFLFFGFFLYTIYGFISGIEHCITLFYLKRFIIFIINLPILHRGRSYALHPLEAIIQTGIYPILAFTLPLYNPLLGIFWLFIVAYSIYGHLGFELCPKGFYKHWFGNG